MTFKFGKKIKKEDSTGLGNKLERGRIEIIMWSNHRSCRKA